jgi:hypothetical protein
MKISTAFGKGDSVQFFTSISPKGPRRPKWLFAVWAGHCEYSLFLEFLKLFLLVDMDGSFPMSRSMQHLDSRFMSYSVFKISASLWACSQPLSMQQILPKTAQICPNLPKDETLKFHQNLRF